MEPEEYSYEATEQAWDIVRTAIEIGNDPEDIAERVVRVRDVLLRRFERVPPLWLTSAYIPLVPPTASDS